MSFDAGALLFRIQTVGAAIFKQDQSDASQALEKTGRSAKAAASDLDKSGESTDTVGKKARSAKAPLNEQADATKRIGDESKRAKPPQEEQAAVTEKQTAAAKQLSAALLVAGVAVGAMVGLAVAKYSEFDAAISNVRASTMATADEQRELADAALDAGADTAYSAKEAAAAEDELAKAGQTVAQIVGGSLNGALALAAAGQLAVARSAEIMATTMTQFRIPAEQAAHVSDVLAAGAGKAQGSVDDLALALSYVGPLAGSVGFSLNETAGTLAYFATQGIIGEKAGTSLRGVLASLQAPSAAADKEMQKYNISMFDGNGNMLSLAGIAEQLRTRLNGLTEQERLAALGRIFGNEALSAATLLYEGGADAVDLWTKKVDDSGYAAEQAAIKQDNLAGDVEKLGGAFDTALIKTGSGANDVLREMVQSVTALIDWYGELPGPVQTAALVIGVAAAAVLLFTGAAVGLRARFIELQAQLKSAEANFTRTALVGAAAGLALTGVIAVVALLAQRQAEARARAESYADALAQGGDAAKKSAREIVVANLSVRESFLWWEGDSAYDAAKKLGIGIDLVTDAAAGSVSAQRELKDELRSGGQYSDEFKARLEELGLTLSDYITASRTVEEAVDRETEAQKRGIEVNEQKLEADQGSIESSKDSADAYLEAAAGADDLTNSLQQLIDQINKANDVGSDAISSNIDYQNALADVAEVVRKAKEGIDENNDGVADYTLTLDQNTQAGRDNLDMLVDQASKARSAADAQLAVDNNTGAYLERLRSGRQALIDNATALGYSTEEAQALADEIFNIPTDVEVKALVDASQAKTALEDLKASLAAFKNSNYGVNVSGYIRSIERANGGVIEAYAAGGIRENHVAQLARGGAVRIWNEPETQGESYIPLAPAKRARSTEILAETASIFGYALIPAGAKQFASGGIIPGSPATSVLEGVRLTGTLDLGDGLVGFVDARINSYDRERREADRAGFRGGI
jgi:TP901 family phage tail tape measure protein